MAAQFATDMGPGAPMQAWEPPGGPGQQPPGFGPNTASSLVIAPLLAYSVTSVVFAFLWEAMPLPAIVVGIATPLALARAVPAGSFKTRALPGEALWAIGVCMWAVVSGMLTGIYAYEKHTAQYYAMALGNSYDNVLASMPGAAYADAGRIRFADSSLVNVDLSVGYRLSPTFCVAPVLDRGTAQTNTVAFWAIGMDCCPARGNFMCGAQTGQARGGVRARTNGLFDSSHSTYMQAVAQAATVAELLVDPDPILIKWVADPAAEQRAQLLGTFGVLLGGMLIGSLLLFAVLVCATMSRPREAMPLPTQPGLPPPGGAFRRGQQPQAF